MTFEHLQLFQGLHLVQQESSKRGLTPWHWWIIQSVTRLAVSMLDWILPKVARLRYIRMHPGPGHSHWLLCYLPYDSCSLESVKLQSNLPNSDSQYQYISSVHQNPEHRDISTPARTSFSIKTYQDTQLACGLWSRRTFVHSSSRPHWLTNLIWMSRECKLPQQLGWRMMNDA